MRLKKVERLFTLAIGVLIFCAGLSARAGTELGVSGGTGSVKPGYDFYVDIYYDPSTTTSYINNYEITVTYDKDVMEVLSVSPGTHPDLVSPTLEIPASGGYFTVIDDGRLACTSFNARITLVKVKLRVKKLAPLGVASPLHIITPFGRTYSLYNCQKPPTGFLPDGYADYTLNVQPYVETTTYFQQYLDVDGNWLFGETDIDYLFNLVTKNYYNVGGANQVKLGGIQIDFLSNLGADVYDLGLAHAIARPSRFIRSGANGLCNSTAAGDDIQMVTVGNGAPYTVAILPGLNNILNTVPAGDDTIYGQLITTGANGIVETYAAGDDVQNLAYGAGQANGICVESGVNGVINSSVIGDDNSLTTVKDTAYILTNEYYPPGIPERIEIVLPVFTSRDSTARFSKATTVPVLVRVTDEFYNPKPGISPKLTVTTGDARFKIGSGDTTTIQGQPADQFLTLGNAPEGAVGGLLNVPINDNSRITITVNADAQKGLTKNLTEAFYTLTPAAAFFPPRAITLAASDTAIEAGGEHFYATINTKDKNATPVYGFSRNVKLIADRDLGYGNLGLLNEETGDPIMSDNFESGSFPGKNWSVVNPTYITLNTSTPGWFGTNCIRAYNSGGTNWSGYMARTITSTGFSNRIRMSYQWKYFPYTGYNSVMYVQYWDPVAGEWVTVKAHQSQAQLSQTRATGQYLWEEIDLTGVPLTRTGDFDIRFFFDMKGLDAFRIDNVAITGYKTIFADNFEDDSAELFPPEMDYSAYINTGLGGVLTTYKLSDDVNLIPRLEGEANSEAIWSGPNKVYDTVPQLGDTFAYVNKNWVITTGANGVCNTIAAGDDFQLINSSYGKPYARGIVPGLNQALDTTPAGDDELVNPLGVNPLIIVKNGAGANGSSKYVFIGRGAYTDGVVQQYSLEKRVNLGGYRYAYLSFWTKTFGMNDGGNPKQEFVAEVSDDGGKSWVPIWDFEGLDHVWTYREIQLHNDPRFTLVDGFIIRFRASMNYPESSDAAYIDELLVFGSMSLLDQQHLPLDDDSGNYLPRMESNYPGSFRVAAVYIPETINATTGSEDLPIKSAEKTLVVSAPAIDPATVQFVPNNFKLNACERLDYSVIGKTVGSTEGFIDITSMFRLEIHGPARMVEPGILQAACFGGTTKPKFYIRAIPTVAGLLDPVAEGEGVQTGSVSGFVYNPVTYAVVADAPVIIDMGTSKIYTKTDVNGGYIVATAPTGSGYSIKAMKSGFKMGSLANQSVVVGANPNKNITLQTSADCDGDGALDAADTDDDNDSFTDAQETTATTTKCNPDSDGDGVTDGADKFPKNANESTDSDNDGTGDNADADDDGDGLTDVEETTLGADGYITDPKKADTDNGGLNDYQEYVQHKNPLSAGDDLQTDTDGDGLYNSVELGGGACGVAWTQVNTKSKNNVADSDADGLNDYTEVNTYKTNPSCADTDGDRLSDSIEGFRCDNELSADTDADGLCDGDTTVMNGSTVVCVAGEDLDRDGTLDAGETNPCNIDSDSDLMPDKWEKLNGLNPRVNDAASDADSDGLNNLSEYVNNCNPNDADSDNGGEQDGAEVTGGRNPLDPSDDQPTVSIGDGSTSWFNPLGAWYHDDRTQVIYLASEIKLGGSIKSLSLNVTTIPGQMMTNFTIRMKHTSLGVYAPSPQWESTAWTVVYQANTTISQTGWYTFTFATPFAYNSANNLIIDYSFNNSTYTTNGIVKASIPGGNRSLYFQNDSGYGDPLAWAGTSNPTPVVSTIVPDIKLWIDAIDSDADGLQDGWEVNLGTDPRDADTDDDGLNDGQEVVTYFTNPLDSDCDDDGMLDGWEVSHGLNPLVPNWGTIRVSSAPSGAKVFMDGNLAFSGQYLGVSGSAASPLILSNVKNRKYTITLVAADYFIYQTYVSVDLGGTFDVNPTLVYRVLEVLTQGVQVSAGGVAIATPGGYSAPQAVDFDRNGTVDLLAGNGDGQVVLYNNLSANSLNLQAGVFLAANSVNIDVGAKSKPFIVDWNNDSCPDLLVGNGSGEVWLFTGSASCNGTFGAGSQLLANGSPLVVAGGEAAPWVVDWSGDNKKDLVVGTGDGRVMLFTNSGTDQAPVLNAGAYLLDKDGAEIKMNSSAYPFVYDIDRDGHLDLVIGEGDGKVSGCLYSEAVGDGLYCVPSALTTIYQDVVQLIDAGDNSALAVGDVNGDRQLDLLLGNAAGQVYYYQSSHLIGDIDRSTKVDGGDLILLKQSLGICKGSPGYNPGADLNGDNCVAVGDQTILINNFGKTY